jgi:outer membrane protein assembly factor BamB
LPDGLPEQATFLWEKRLSNQALGGIAATERFVIVPDRDALDASDIFRCLSAKDGSEIWKVRYLARGNLDYGNSSRATPLIHDGRVYLFGAMGHLHCVKLETGNTVWKRELARQFQPAEELPWGFCGSPLLVDDKIIVTPGAADAAIVALSAETGEVVWKTPGDLPSYGSLIVATLGGKRQIVGHDKTSLGGWDIGDGHRLWRLDPPRKNDFNVPTPSEVNDRLLVSTENNGTRLYAFDNQGVIVAEPVATNLDLVPDAHSPVVVGDRVFGISSGLFCLDLNNGLQAIWKTEDQPFQSYGSIIGSSDRILVTTQRGQLLLIDGMAGEYRALSQLPLFKDEPGIYSHPALVGDRLYVRSSGAVHCLVLPSIGQNTPGQ